MNNNIKCMVLGVALLGALAATGCDNIETELKTPQFKTGLPDKDLKSADFEKVFPRQYASFLRNNEDTVMTEYKGSVPYHKNDDKNPLPKGFKNAQPYLKNLWLGYPFMYEYNETRGHTHAIEDFVHIDRINRYSPDGAGNMPATCWNCKTPKMMTWIAEHGDKFWAMDVNQFRDKIDVKEESVSCATCHDTSNMELRLYSEPLKDWLNRSGKKWENLSRNEKRSLMCAQCHVEYYFTHPDNGPKGRPVFPWDNGFDPEQMYQYYNTHGPKNGPFFDFIHAASGVKIIKAQHPEYETWINGTHGAAGVSCADCHMPYEKAEGKKMSSHWWTSPLKDPKMSACRQCHADKTPEFLRERVKFIQEKTFRQLLKAQEASVRGHEAVRLANAYTGEKAANYEALMNESREMVRKGQFFWDYISAENSMGFHNPAKALDTLMTSLECSNKAVDLAIQATKGGIVPAISGDIQKIVPPILEHSRKLQQDPAHLASHPWLKLLPALPQHDMVWDGVKRLSK